MTDDRPLTADDHAGERGRTDYDAPYPSRERFDAEFSKYRDDDGNTVALIEETERRGAWLLSTRSVPVEP